jgi:hypothetical protein
MTRILLVGLGVCGLGLVGWWSLAGEPAAPAADPNFEKELKEAVAKYLTWGRADDRSRWAPEDCRAPSPPRARASASTEEKTHGRKLYSVFAKDPLAYAWLTLPERAAAVGQVVVKQSWVPEEVTGEEAAAAIAAEKKGWVLWVPPKGAVPKAARPEGTPEAVREDGFNPYVVRDGKVFKAAKQGDLFVMLKLDPKTPGTDDGWVYGTVSPDGKTVSSAGRLESCMKCHVEAKTDRLFGLPREAPGKE